MPLFALDFLIKLKSFNYSFFYALKNKFVVYSPIENRQQQNKILFHYVSQSFKMNVKFFTHSRSITQTDIHKRKNILFRCYVFSRYAFIIFNLLLINGKFLWVIIIYTREGYSLF